MKTLLAIDTSTEACSVALLNKKEITHDFVISQRDHTKQILPMIDKLLAQSSCSLSQVDAIAFSKGPGSFTGVRIGIGVAQGLSLGLGCPLIGVSSLMALAQGANRISGAKKVITAIDARMNEVYLGGYEQVSPYDWQALVPEMVIKPELVANYLEKVMSDSSEFYFAGTGWQTYPNMLNNIKDAHHLLPDSQDIILIAEKMFKQGEFTAVEDVEPTYLRNEVTWNKLPGK